jgi:hypothetical protein
VADRSLSAVRADAAPVVGAFLALGLGCALPLLRDLDLLSLGEESRAARRRRDAAPARAAAVDFADGRRGVSVAG